MSITPPDFRRLLLPILFAGWTTGSLPAQEATQSITLQPGWNAVWIEVKPSDNTTEALFAGMPVGSVWSWLERGSTAEFIQSVSEESFKEAGWQRWFPASRPESILNNLFSIQANRAYLIRFDGTAPAAWNITGRPSLRLPAWAPDAFNLRGAPVDPAAPPTFLEFFRHSPAHYDAALAMLQPIFRLNSVAGTWEQVAEGDPVHSGQAYWIMTKGASSYHAPLELGLEVGDGLDFGLDLVELKLNLRNLRTSPINALLKDSAGAATVLSHYTFAPATGGQWPSLPAELATPVPATMDVELVLAVRRQDHPLGISQSILEIRDGAGTRHLVPVSSEVPGAGTPAGGTFNPRLAGLWLGSAAIKAVSEAHASDAATPTPTGSEFNLRVILHVDSTGQVRLLKEVTQMWRDGTFTTGPGGEEVIDRAGEYVLLTDETLIPSFSGAVARDSETVGRRLSTIAYDFPTTPAANFLILSGDFRTGASLAGTIILPHDHPTNPFKHRYHPDHDNLDERFDAAAVESYDVTRQLTFIFAASPPGGPATPDFGYNQMGGTYRETITGIHNKALHLSGTFLLNRISPIAVLNPAPTP